MSKYKKPDKAQTVATATTDDRLFAVYCAMLASTDWRRDVRKQDTIMQEVLKSARLALEVYDNEEIM